MSPSACLLLLLYVPHSPATLVINKKEKWKVPIAVVCKANRVVREKLPWEGRYHGQLKLRNAKLLPFPGVSEFYYTMIHFGLRRGQTVAPNILSFPFL